MMINVVEVAYKTAIYWIESKTYKYVANAVDEAAFRFKLNDEEKEIVRNVVTEETLNVSAMRIEELLKMLEQCFMYSTIEIDLDGDGEKTILDANAVKSAIVEQIKARAQI